jgi:hypothetical protein
MGYDSIGCKIKAVGCWGWVPRFVLGDVELVEVRYLYVGLACFPSEVGSA